MKKIWLVEFPTYKYNEDVKEIARKQNLKIRDSRFKANTNPEVVIADAEAPKLTIKKEYAKK